MTLAATTAAFLIGANAPALSQSEVNAPATTVAAASQSHTRAEQKTQAKAQRKAARVKKNAELKKLEDAGYNQAQRDPEYPQNLQAAQKKANASSGASQ